MEFRNAVMVTLAVELTDRVVIWKLADDAPAAMVTLAGMEASAVLDVRLTVVAVEAGALKVTVPWTLPPPVTLEGLRVKPEIVCAVVAGGVTVKIALCAELP